MTEPSAFQSAIAEAILIHYDFDLGSESAEKIVMRWRSQYQLDWLRLAAIEALYQGRYKAISVQQILALWQRRQQPIYHFNSEFESLICRHLPKYLSEEVETVLSVPEERQELSEEESASPAISSEAESVDLSPATPEVTETVALEESSSDAKLQDLPPATPEVTETVAVEESSSKAKSVDLPLVTLEVTETVTVEETPPEQSVKHTDFYSKLKSVAESAPKTRSRLRHSRILREERNE